MDIDELTNKLAEGLSILSGRSEIKKPDGIKEVSLDVESDLVNCIRPQYKPGILTDKFILQFDKVDKPVTVIAREMNDAIYIAITTIKKASIIDNINEGYLNSKYITVTDTDGNVLKKINFERTRKELQFED